LTKPDLTSDDNSDKELLLRTRDVPRQWYDDMITALIIQMQIKLFCLQQDKIIKFLIKNHFNIKMIQIIFIKNS